MPFENVNWLFANVGWRNESWLGKDKLIDVKRVLDGFMVISLAVQCNSKEVLCNRPKCGFRGWRNKKHRASAIYSHSV